MKQKKKMAFMIAGVQTCFAATSVASSKRASELMMGFFSPTMAATAVS